MYVIILTIEENLLLSEKNNFCKYMKFVIFYEQNLFKSELNSHILVKHEIRIPKNFRKTTLRYSRSSFWCKTLSLDETEFTL